MCFWKVFLEPACTLLQTFEVLQPGCRGSQTAAIADISKKYQNQYGEAVRASEREILHTCSHQTSVDCSTPDGRISGSSSEGRHIEHRRLETRTGIVVVFCSDQGVCAFVWPLSDEPKATTSVHLRT
jgi:hypothetical protein